MSRPPRVARTGADCRADVVAVGAPALVVADADREQIEDLLAELLLADLESEEPGP